MISSDGKNFVEDTAHDPVLSTGDSTKFDSLILWCPVVWKEGSTWNMLYGGSNSSTNSQNYIGFATSSDGVTWTKQNNGNPVFSGAGWCASDVEPWGIIKIGATYYLWFSTLNGVNVSPYYCRQVGLATSNNLMSWTQDANNPIFSGAPGTVGSYCGVPFTYNGSYYFLVTQNGGYLRYRLGRQLLTCTNVTRRLFTAEHGRLWVQRLPVEALPIGMASS